MYKIAVLASTNGTDMQAIIDEMKAGKMPGIELTLVISNKKSSYALKRAKEQGFRALFIDPKNKTREDFDMEMSKIIEKHKIDLICLIGYMRILSKKFVNKFLNKIVNVHPSLIPKYCGKNFHGTNVHEAVLESGDKETGMTLHYVNEGVDTGEIIFQKKCYVYEDDTVESLKERVQSLEKLWYPELIRQFAEESIDQF